MTLAQGIRAGAAYIELYANDNRLVRGLNRAQKRLKTFSVGVRDLGRRMVILSAIMATPLIAGVKVFADFEQQMANVSTMLAEPEKHMGRFRQGIREMAVEFGESTETLAGGLYDILSASIPAEKALDVLAVSAKAAKAGMTDTATAADAITTVLNAYGLSAEHAASVSDFCSVKLSNAASGTDVKSEWIYVGGEAADLKDHTISEHTLTGSGTGFIAFSLSPGEQPFPRGNYVVRLSIEGEKPVKIPFKVE